MVRTSPARPIALYDRMRAAASGVALAGKMKPCHKAVTIGRDGSFCQSLGCLQGFLYISQKDVLGVEIRT